MRMMMTAILAATLLTGQTDGALAGKKDDTIRFAYDQAPESVDPYFNNVRIGVILGQLTWDTLIYRDPVTNEYKGQLAKSWTWVDDKTLDFDLREGVVFHNGEEFDADDVVYTLNFVAKADNKVVTQSNVNWIESAEKRGKYQVRLKLKKPFPGAIEYLSGPIVIHPDKYYAEAGPQGMNAKPIGSGPYRIVEHVPGKTIKLEANPAYFKDSPKGKPGISKIEVRILPDRQTQVAEAMAGGLDFIMNVPKDQAAAMQAAPFLSVAEGETMRIVFLNFNTLETTPTPALRDKRVREAIALSIDRKTMVKQLVGEKGRVINAICFPSQVGCDDSKTARFDYNPAKAKALLAEAGFANGLEFDLYAYRERDQSEAIIGYLRAVGIKANLKFMQYAAMREQIRSSKAAVTHQTWGSFSVNDVSASTPVYYKFSADDINRDPEVRDLLEKGDTSVELATRKDAYSRALAMIQDKALGVPLYSLSTNYVANKDLVFTAYPDELPRFWEMRWK